MSELTTVARPYAKAAFDFAVESGAVTQWHEMLNFAAEVAINDDIIAYLAGSHSPEVTSDLFVKVCGEQLNEQGQNFIKVLAENGRLVALPAVAVLFEEQKALYENEIEVDVTSATEISEAHLTTLVASLEKRLARKIKLNCNIDSSVVGGLLIRSGDTVIDATIRGKLERLSNVLQS
ncbi:ATP synthase subunit delta [Psychrosphaera saromensis]|jgi:F-type H+-transporting ATPase subunit delta|uniref:ATP synthase subunit delta n=1 Tax=Psychrosphaera saromensis TaxID=716813 RepID=A0A2S7UTG5_9GAMM|nr:F0F1 ATP synthase subunit delta [Psychrosphaera saromensis]PQJ52822.1 F0F1 ATP synthase subunit delta [Psychrosphaera saromensis]GHB71528.1 ATP synthase subunit delta [Psychrosphaera saromensis]GLQ13324.1 ATP synthase subunit delta [Psychrosphaera saromensis]